MDLIKFTHTDMKLVRFLMRLANEVVTIELKSGATLTGTIVGVDNNMNVHLKVVTMTPKGKEPVSMDRTTVRGNTLRDIILPESLNLDTYLIDDTPRMKVKAAVKSLLRKLWVPQRNGLTCSCDEEEECNETKKIIKLSDWMLSMTRKGYC